MDRTKALIDRSLGGHFDHHDPALQDDPYPLYAALRSKCPVLHSEEFGGFWVLSKYEDIFYAYHHPEIFSSYPNAVPDFGGRQEGQKMIPLEVDPPEHGVYRRALEGMFGLREMAKLEDDIRSEARRLLDGMMAQGSCEFISDFALPLPTGIFMRILGLPAQETARFVHWNDMFIHGVEGGTAEEIAAVRETAQFEISNYFAEMIEERVEHPRDDDLVSRLLATPYDDERLLTEFEVLNICFLLFIAGLDTVKAVLGNSVAFLAENPGHRHAIIDGSASIREAVEELLRYESPIMPGRTLTQDFEMHGVQMREGDRVLLLAGSSGRDEAEFEDADAVVFDRHPNRHLAFGVGVHRCLGSHLARMELRIALEELHARIPHYRVPNGETIHRSAAFVRRVERLPLVWDAN